MQKVFIVKTNRTPFGKIGGLLAPVRPDDLLAHCLRNLTENLNFPHHVRRLMYLKQYLKAKAFKIVAGD